MVEIIIDYDFLDNIEIYTLDKTLYYSPSVAIRKLIMWASNYDSDIAKRTLTIIAEIFTVIYDKPNRHDYNLV